MLLKLAFHRFKSLPLVSMKFFTKNSGDNRFARHTTSHVLPSFRSNYRDSAQTCPRCARFFARTLENEEPLTGTHIPTCRPWGWFSMDSRGKGKHGLYPRRGKGKEKCFTRRSNGADLFRAETPWLGAIEMFNDKDGEVFEMDSRAIVKIVRMKNRCRDQFVSKQKILLNRYYGIRTHEEEFTYFSYYFQCYINSKITNVYNFNYSMLYLVIRIIERMNISSLIMKMITSFLRLHTTNRS